MEEDIKILEELIKHNYLEDVGYLREDNDYEKFNQAIENLIKGYRELEEKVTMLEGNKIGYKLAIEDSIPKSKIKEKIEELKNKFEYKKVKSKYTKEELDNKDIDLNDYVLIEIIEKVSEVLQELMEDK